MLPKWVMDMAEDVAISDPTNVSLAKKYSKSRTTVLKYQCEEEFKKIVEERRAELVNQYRSKMNTLVSKAFDTYHQALNQKKIDKYKFDAATTLLKSLGLLHDKQEVEHSGEVHITLASELDREYK